MKRLPEILAAIILTPIALLAGLLLAAAIVPLMLIITALLFVAVPYIVLDAMICAAMEWPNWSERQRIKKQAESGSPPGAFSDDTPTAEMPTMDGEPVCLTCQRRSRASGRDLGTAWCQECGKEYTVIA